MPKSSDLLFNPPRLHKKKIKQSPTLERFDHGVEDLFLLENGQIMVRDNRQTVRIYKKKGGELQLRGGRNLESDALVTGNGERFAVSQWSFGKEREFILTALGEEEDIITDKPALPEGQEAYALCLTSSHLYTLCQNSDGSSLWRVSTGKNGSWRQMTGYSSKGLIKARRAGQRTVLLFPGQNAKDTALVTAGVGGICSRFLVNDTKTKITEKTLLAPAREDGVYLALSQGARGQALVRFDLKNSSTLSFYYPGDKEVLALDQSANRIFVLTEDELLLFRENDLQLTERLPLREKFDALTSSSGEAILYRRGEPFYQHLILRD